MTTNLESQNTVPTLRCPIEERGCTPLHFARHAVRAWTWAQWATGVDLDVAVKAYRNDYPEATAGEAKSRVRGLIKGYHKCPVPYVIHAGSMWGYSGEVGYMLFRSLKSNPARTHDPLTIPAVCDKLGVPLRGAARG